MRDEMTVLERILLAAHALAARNSNFTAEDLIVESWRLYPDHFGLQGYSKLYPDSNRILTKIMGTGGLRGKGWLERVGEKRYRLTEVGRLAAEALNGAPPPVASARATDLDRRLVGTLVRMLDSPAFEKFREQRPLTFSDVCSFWNISPRSTANQLVARTSDADKVVAEALKLAESSKSAEVSLPGHLENVSVTELRELQALSTDIREKFNKELEVIMRRTDERRL